MAFLKDISTRKASCVAIGDPLDGNYGSDIIIDGIAYDTATFLPKIGKNVVDQFDQNATLGAYTHALDGVSSGYKLTPMAGDTSYYYTGAIFGGNWPMAMRHMNDNRVVNADAHRQQIQGRRDLLGRDWLEDPAYAYTVDFAKGNVYVSNGWTHRTGINHVYDISNGRPAFNDCQYYNAPTANELFIQWGLNDYGAVGVAMTGGTTYNCMTVRINPYSRNTDLINATHDQIYAPTLDATRQHFVKLTTLDNGDFVYYSQNSNTQNRVGHIENSTNANVQDYYYSTPSAQQMLIPSNVVRHNDTGETNTGLKISYIPLQNSTASYQACTYAVIEMDTAANTVNVTPTTNSTQKSTANIASKIDPYPSSDINYFGNYFDCRIISQSQDLQSQKYVMAFTASASEDDLGSSAAYNLHNERVVSVRKINAADKSNLQLVFQMSWEDILTQSTRNDGLTNPAAGLVPWCVAPLNPEHSLMMVFCYNTTHIIKWNFTTEEFEEMWFDENTIFNAAQWFPTGKVLTSEWNEKYRGVGNPGTIVDGFQSLQIWSEDMIYKLDILPDTSYTTYSGSDVTSNITFNAYDANGARVATSIKVEITGPAVFDNSTQEKTFTLDGTADTVQTITINGDGQIEFRVVEIQSV